MRYAKLLVRLNLTPRVRLNHTGGMSNPAIEEAYDKAGGRPKVMASLKVSKQSLSDWKRWGYVPAEHAAALERLSGVSRWLLTPEFDWGDAPPMRPSKRSKSPEAKVA